MIHVELPIRRTDGDRPGMVGWLLSNMSYVHIGLTEKDNQAAWLMNKKGNIITILAYRNNRHDERDGDVDGPISIIYNLPNYQNDDNFYDTLYSTISFTKAAWKIVKAIAEAAIKEMEVVDVPPELVTIEVKRTNDPTTISIAVDALQQKNLMPILIDRLKDTEE